MQINPSDLQPGVKEALCLGGGRRKTDLSSSGAVLPRRLGVNAGKMAPIVFRGKSDPLVNDCNGLELAVGPHHLAVMLFFRVAWIDGSVTGASYRVEDELIVMRVTFLLR